MVKSHALYHSELERFFLEIWEGEMSEIPESLRGWYATSSTIASDAFEPFVKKGHRVPVQARVHVGATKLTAVFAMDGVGSKEELGESNPRAKIQNLVLSNVMGEERAAFTLSDEDGKPDPSTTFVVDKDGLHLDDAIIDALSKQLEKSFEAQIRAIPEKKRPAAQAQFKQMTKDQFGVLSRYEGTETTSLPLMVGGGAALLLLLMVK